MNEIIKKEQMKIENLIYEIRGKQVMLDSEMIVKYPQPNDTTKKTLDLVSFESINKVIKESKKTIKFQPKLQQLFNEVDNYTKGHQTLENGRLNVRVNKLTKDNTKLKTRLEAVLKAIKEFFRKIGNELSKKLPQVK